MTAVENMKTNILIIFPFILLALFLLVVGHATAQEWIHFSSGEGRFSILMPGKPTEGKIDLHTGDLTVTARTFTALSPSIDLMCGYYSLPPSQKKVDEIFDETRDGSIRKVKGMLLTEKKVTLDGYPGRRFRSTGIGNAMLDEEMYLVDQRFYLITITTATKNPDKNIDKIFDSFRIRPKEQ
jgi:hypothetical protein